MKSDWSATLPPSRVTGDAPSGGVAGDMNLVRAALAEIRSFVPNSLADIGGSADPSLTAPPVHAVGNSGAALTLDAGSPFGWVKTLTLTANCVFTLTGAAAGRVTTLELYLTQGGVGGFTVTWPGSVKWDFGSSPILSTVPGSVDCVVLRSVTGGSSWLGNLVGAGYA